MCIYPSILSQNPLCRNSPRFLKRKLGKEIYFAPSLARGRAGLVAGAAPQASRVVARLRSALYSGWIKRWRDFCFSCKTAGAWPRRTRRAVARCAPLSTVGGQRCGAVFAFPAKRQLPTRREREGAIHTARAQASGPQRELSCAATHPQARRRLVQPSHGPRTRGCYSHRRGAKPPPHGANCPARSRATGPRIVL